MAEFEKTFDNAAADYDNTRPMYVDGIFEDIFRYRPLDSHSHVLEIGIGTGKATLPFLAKGCSLTALEPGGNLADMASDRYREYGNFRLYKQSLQDFTCAPETFDLIYSATAFHWIPEEYGYNRVYELLKKGGAFARFAYHAGPDKGRTALASQIQSLYQSCMGSREEPKEYGEEDALRISQIAAKYGFTQIRHKLYHMTKDFTAEEYLALLRTYPDHMKLPEPNRERLFGGIYRAIREHGGTITIYYAMDLQLARKE